MINNAVVWFLSILMITTSSSAGHSGGKGTSGCDYQFSITDDHLRKNNGMNVRRDAPAYGRSLGGQFLADANALPYESHVLDAGAGQAIALEQLANGFNFGDMHVQLKSRGLTALAITKPNSFSIGLLERMPGRMFRYLKDKYIEDYSFDEIGVCDLIIDVLGPFSYTGRIDLVLKKYLQLLKIGGKAYINIYDNRVQMGGQSLVDYLNSIKGVKITWFKGAEGRTFCIEKTGWTDENSVRELHVKDFKDGAPPYRFYW